MANQYKNKVVYNGTTLIDLSDTTAVQSDVASGKYFYTASGEKVLGTAETGGDSSYTRTVIAVEQTVTPTSNGTYYSATLNVSEGFEADAEYIITYNGTEYFFTCQVMWGTNYLLGDINYFYGGSDLPYPFGIIWMNGTTCTLARNSGNQVTIKIEKLELTGSGGGGGSSTLITKTITENGTYLATDDGADGYSSVTVNVPSGGSTMNTQTAQSTTRRNNTALGSITSLTCSTAGTYDVYWTCARSSTSGTWGSRLYINGTAYGSENTTFTNHVQTNHLTGVTIPANTTVAIYGRSRSGYYIYVPQLTIVQTN